MSSRPAFLRGIEGTYLRVDQEVEYGASKCYRRRQPRIQAMTVASYYTTGC